MDESDKFKPIPGLPPLTCTPAAIKEMGNATANESPGGSKWITPYLWVCG